MKSNKLNKCNFSWRILLKTICAFLPTIWMPIVINWIGQYIGFVEVVSGSKKITTIGWIVTIVVFIIIFSYLYLNNSKLDINILNKEKELLEQNNKLLDDIISGMIHNSTKKCDRYINFIKKNKKCIDIENVIDCVDPIEQIKIILESISMIFYFLTKECSMKQQDIVVTLAFNANNNWQWIGDNSLQDGLAMETLLENPYTTLYHTIKGKANFIFHPDKIDANKKNEYVYDERDIDNLNIGSIVCKKLICCDDVNAVLSITTYGNKMVREDADINKTRTLIKNILVPFEKRIVEECIMLYVKNAVKN